MHISLLPMKSKGRNTKNNDSGKCHIFTATRSSKLQENVSYILLVSTYMFFGVLFLLSGSGTSNYVYKTLEPQYVFCFQSSHFQHLLCH